MAFTKAGLWGPQAIIDSTGHPQPGATATLYLPDEVTLASLWTTSAKSVAVANPTQADIHANLHFWTDPGQYRLRVNVGTVVTWLDVEVPIDPGEAAQDQDVVAAQAAAEAYADGIVAAGLATKQPLDSDLTAIAALATTAFGRGLLILADATAGRAAFGSVIGTDVQAHDSDLDAIAALATTAFGRALLVLADAAALRTAAGLGTAATHATGDFDAAGTAAAAVAALVNGAPGALDTLNELATALADDASFATTITNALAAKSPILNPTAVKTGDYTAAATDYVLCDTSGGIFTVTLPTAPADKTSIAVDLVASGNTLTIARGGADVFQKTGGPTSLTMNTANRVLVFQYQSATAVWHVQDHLPAVINTKGDLLTYGTERARLPVGADGALLGADSTQTTGLKWIPSGTYASADSLPTYVATGHGLVCNAIIVTDGTIAGGALSTLTSATGKFTAGHVGRTVVIDGAGPAGASLITTISAFNSVTSVGLTAAASGAVTNALVTWGTDDTAALNALWSTIAAAGGGTLYLPSHCLCTGQLTQPATAAPVRLQGSGAGLYVGQGLTNKLQANPNGSVLVLTTATGPAKILTLYQAFIEVDRLAVLSAANETNPIWLTTEGVLKINRTTQWSGRPSMKGTACVQDVFVLGGAGTTTGTGDATLAFQGYGTVFDSPTFGNVRCGIWARSYANSVWIDKPQFGLSCGAANVFSVADGAMTAGSAVLTSASAPFTAGMVGQIVFVAGAGSTRQNSLLACRISAYTSATQVTLSQNAVTTVSAAQVTAPSGFAIKIGGTFGAGSGAIEGVVIDAPLIEVTNYACAIAFVNQSVGNSVNGVTFWDGGAYTAAGIFTDAGSIQNFFEVNYNAVSGTSPPLAEEVVGSNSILNAGQTGAGYPNHTASQLLALLRMLGGLNIATSQALGFEDGTGASVNNLSRTATFAANTIVAAGGLAALGDLFGGVAANFLKLGAEGTSDTWVDAQGSSTNVALNLRSKGNRPIIARSHIESAASASSAAAVSTNATGVSVTNAVDNAGTVNLTTAASIAADTSVVTVTFATAWGGVSGVAPRGIAITPNGAAAAAAQPYLVSKSTTTFVVGLHNPPAGATAMSFDFVCFG